jgi:hypothetical protein
MAGSAALQAPHLPVSAMCFAGIRFCIPHAGQRRMMAISISFYLLDSERRVPDAAMRSSLGCAQVKSGRFAAVVSHPCDGKKAQG